MTLSEIPIGFNAYDRIYPEEGYTARIAINPEGLDFDLGEAGFILSEDQASPVMKVLLQKNSEGTQPLPEKIRVEALRIAHEHMGFKPIRKQSAFDFAVAHKDLLLQGRVPSEVAQYRLTVCTGKNEDGEKVSTQCPAYTGDVDGRRGSGHCEGCGCPKWEIAEMDRNGFMESIAPGKAWYPMGCPKGRFSAEPGRRSAARD